MNIKLEKLENNVVKLEINVEQKAFNEALKKSYKKNLKKFNIPGFRKGKVPMAIVKRYYGEGVLYEDAINFCCDDTYPKAVEENKLEPIDYPRLAKEIVDYVDKNFDDVGTEFATEALKMHYNVIEKRNIKGSATVQEEKILKEEGIGFFKIPFPKIDDEKKN